MVEMQMGIDNHVDLVRPAPGDLAERVGECPLARDAVHLDLARRPFLAHAGLDEDLLPAGINEQAIAVELNPVEFVGRRDTLPKDTRDDAEHGSAVESKLG